MVLDLAGDIARLHRHVGCLERAAADQSAPVEVRARVAAMAQAARTAADLAGHLGLLADPTNNEEEEPRA